MLRLRISSSFAPWAGRRARRPPWPFAMSDAPVWLDQMARAYGCRPSQLLRGSLEDLRLDLTCWTRAEEERARTARRLQPMAVVTI